MKKRISVIAVMLVGLILSQLLTGPLIGLANTLESEKEPASLELSIINGAGERLDYLALGEQENFNLEITSHSLLGKTIFLQLSEGISLDQELLENENISITEDKVNNRLNLIFKTESETKTLLKFKAVKSGTHNLTVSTSDDENLSRMVTVEVTKHELVPNKYQAKRELKHLGFVETISFNPQKIRCGDLTKMQVTFSSNESNNYLRVYPGDTLTLTLPDNLTAFYRSKPVEVVMSGEVVGYAQVNKDDLKTVIIEFNDVVAGYQYITKGCLEMEVQTDVLSQPGIEEHVTNLGTDAEPAPYTIYQTQGGTGGKFFSKVGNIQPSDADTVWWYIRVNSNYSGFEEDVIVTDILGPGQKIPTDVLTDSFFRFFQKEDDKIKELNSLSFKEAQDAGYVSIEMLDNVTTQFVFYKEKIPANLHLEAYFKTSLTDEGRLYPEVENKATAIYQQNAVVKEEEVKGSAKVPSASGVVYPGRGVLKLMKYMQKDDETTPLSGVTFDLYRSDDTLVQANLITQEDGVIELPHLDFGDYYVLETGAPNIVEFDPYKKHEFTVKDDDKGVILPIINYAKEIPGELEAHKLVSKELANIGEKVTYTIVAKNIVKDSVLNNVIVEDYLPKGLKLVSDSIKLNGKVVDSEIIDNGFKMKIASIEGMSEAKISFDAVITDEAGLQIKNIAKVTPKAPIEPKKPEVDMSVIPKGKLEARKLVNKKLVNAGEKVTYTIVARNTVAGSTLTNIIVEDLLPEGLALVEESVRLDGELVDHELKENGFRVLIPRISGVGESRVTFDAVVTKEAEDRIKNVAKVIPEDPKTPDEPLEPSVEIPVAKPLPDTGGSGIITHLFVSGLLLMCSFSYLNSRLKKEVL